MSQKAGIAHERVMLFSRFSERSLSESIKYLICSRIGKYDERDHHGREAEAKRIREIIDSCETEQEMIERIESVTLLSMHRK